MELGGENRAGLVNHALIAGVIKVDEILLPILREGRGVHSITVILTGDVTPPTRQVKSRDVVRSVSIFQFYRSSTSRQSEELVAQADTHNRDLRRLHEFTEMIDGFLTMSRVARP